VECLTAAAIGKLKAGDPATLDTFTSTLHFVCPEHSVFRSVRIVRTAGGGKKNDGTPFPTVLLGR